MYVINELHTHTDTQIAYPHTQTPVLTYIQIVDRRYTDFTEIFCKFNQLLGESVTQSFSQPLTQRIK